MGGEYQREMTRLGTGTTRRADTAAPLLDIAAFLARIVSAEVGGTCLTT
jgi:hypothetical protein